MTAFARTNENEFALEKEPELVGVGEGARITYRYRTSGNERASSGEHG